MHKNIHGTAKGREFVRLGDGGTVLYDMVAFYSRRKGTTFGDYLDYLEEQSGGAFGSGEIDDAFGAMVEAQRMGLLEVM